MEVEFVIPSIPLSLNVVLRMHWTERQKEQERWDFYVFGCWLQHNRPVFLRPVTIEYIIGFPKKRIRDIDNYIGGTKYLTDALKKTFLLRDDAEWLRRIEIGFTLCGRNETKIKIEEV